MSNSEKAAAAFGLLMAIAVSACASLPPVAKSAMDLLLPVAADALTEAVRDRFDSEPDESTAVCFELPADAVGSESGMVYVVCRAKAAE